MSKELLKTIPNNLFLYWDGSPMSFLQYLTVFSFKKYHPDFNIIIYTPTKKFNVEKYEIKERYTGKNYWCKIKEKEKIDPKIKIEEIDFEKIGFVNDCPEVIKSDYIRYWALYKYGGIWSDFDIIYLKSIYDIDYKKYMINKNDTTIDTVVTYFDKYYSIGFLCQIKITYFLKI